MARVVAAATVVPLLALTTACGGGSGHGSTSSGKRHSTHRDTGGSGRISKSDDGDVGRGTHGGRREDDRTRPSPRTGQPLTSRQLVTALLRDGDVPGVRTQAGQGPKPDETLRADRPACQPVADLLGARSAVPRTGQARTTLLQQTGQGGVVTPVLLASYARGGAERVLRTVREAMRDCTAFTATDGTGETTRYQVRQVSPQPRAGDDALAFDLLAPRQTTSEESGAMRVTLLRTSGNTATFLSFDPMRGTPAPVAQQVLDKQHAKLLRAATARR